MTRKKKRFLFPIHNNNNKRLHLGRSLQQKSSPTTKLNQDWSSVRSIRNQHNSNFFFLFSQKKGQSKHLKAIITSSTIHQKIFSHFNQTSDLSHIILWWGPLLLFSILSPRLYFRFSLQQISTTPVPKCLSDPQNKDLKIIQLFQQI